MHLGFEKNESETTRIILCAAVGLSACGNGGRDDIFAGANNKTRFYNDEMFRMISVIL